MRVAKLLLICLCCAQSAFAAGAAVQRRLTGLEKRVTNVEKRVTRLEQGAARPAAARPKGAASSSPIAVRFLRKKQVVGEKIGLMLYLEFENVSDRRYYAFSGVLVFRDETGAVVWTRPYAYSEAVSPGDKVEAGLPVSSDSPKEYLRLLRAKSLTVALEQQEAYGAD